MKIDIRCDSDPIYGTEWFAYDDLTYDVDCDQDGYFSNSPMGRGKSPWEAMRDLIDQMEEEENEGR